jgi:hypothetical protein
MNCLNIRERQYKTNSRREADLKNERVRVLDRTVDTMVCASMLVLIDEFGFGTRQYQRSRLLRFKNALEKLLFDSAEFYEEAMMEGLRNRLMDRGITYVRT